MFDRKALKQHFGSAAVGYDSSASLQQMVLQDAISYAHDYWKAGDDVADIGCGTGRLAEEVQKQNFGWHVTGFDIAFGMCAYARQRCSRVIVADAHALPIADGTMDGVFSSLMIQWADAPVEVLKEIKRILRPGSYAVVTSFTLDTLRELRHVFSQIDNYQHVSHFHSMNDYRRFTIEAGLEAIWLREKNILEYYPDAVSLMRSIKAIGASFKGENRKPGLMTARQLDKLGKTYSELYGTAEGLPLSWQLLYMILKA